MKKVITYGTYDLLHYGHTRLLERAKALGDYLIVGVTSDDFDKSRGKINVQQSLNERVAAVKATGIPDEVIIEEYEGQKIDDIIKYGVDIFTVGSDWVGYFDYLKEYCDVVYLDRTQGISSTQLRGEKRSLSLGMVGGSPIMTKLANECSFVNGVNITALCTDEVDKVPGNLHLELVTSDYDVLLDHVDAVYVHSEPKLHYEQVKKALEKGKHVLCETPIALVADQVDELFELARENGVVLMEALKTAYSLAYQRLLVLIKSGRIGQIVSVDATCTSLRDIEGDESTRFAPKWNSICTWGPTALLPVFQFLGTDYQEKHIVSRMADGREDYDLFTKIDFIYDKAVASIKVGKGVKSEGELIISGTKGYLYVPAPWWKTDYYETRFENPANNKRYFYQLDGEGIRYEVVAFVRAVENGEALSNIQPHITKAIAGVMEDFYNGKDKKTIG